MNNIFFIHLVFADVIHTVGPIGVQPDMLRSCYLKSLELVTKNKLTSVVMKLLPLYLYPYFRTNDFDFQAFPCISTGIYGYSNIKACPVVLDTVRDWLETENNVESVSKVAKIFSSCC